MGIAIDLTGHRYGRLVVKAVAPSKARNRKWFCVCDCGREVVVVGNSMRTGLTRSCGCLRNEAAAARLSVQSKTHGMFRTREHTSWVAMLGRCRNPSDPSYARYGGRGIKVCRRWEKFENFYADMGPRPAGTTLERKNNERGYMPSNCRWATQAEQSRNKRTNVTGKYQGRTWCVAELAAAHGIAPGTAYQRMRRGISFVDACTTPVRRAK